MVYETEVTFANCKTNLRQIIIKNHGRAEPTFIITNNRDLPLKEVLKVYAKRWHIENKLAELVSFFNLNAISSPLMIRIHFDILWTIIADTIYHRFAKDLPRFENERAIQIQALEETNTSYYQLDRPMTIEEIRKIYRKSCIYFLSCDETFGLPIVELQLCGSYIGTSYKNWAPSHYIKKNVYEKLWPQLDKAFYQNQNKN